MKGENSVKLFGNELEVLESTAEKIRDVLQTVPGITDLAIFNPLGQPTVRIDVDRARAARLGLTTGRHQRHRTGGDRRPGRGGSIRERQRSALPDHRAPRTTLPCRPRRHPPYLHSRARPFRKWRDGTSTVGPGRLGAVGFGTVVHLPRAPERYVPIKFSVRGRDLGSAVLEAERKVGEQVRLPGGYRTEWVGEFGNLQDALHRLALVVPLAIVLICILLFINFGSIVDVLLAASVIPMALIGGIFALALTGTPFSVSAAIGFVALFGIAAMDGIIVLSYYNLHIEQGLDRVTAILLTCKVQMRPVLMTCVVACVGLVPAALSTGIGSQVQRPLALVVVGGMLLTPILVLLVLPVLILLFSQRQPVPEKPRAQEAAV